MALLRRLQSICALSPALQAPHSSFLLRSSRTYSSHVSDDLGLCSWRTCFHPKRGQNGLPWTHRSTILHSSMAMELSIFSNEKRQVATQARPPVQARRMGALKVSLSSPGFIYEPYAPREPISFWKRWFTKSGWSRTKNDIILELKSAFSIAKLRKFGYSRKEFYKEAIELYKEISSQIANGDKNSLRKAVTEKMYSELKNEIKQRESRWSKVYWEMIEPVVLIRTLRARLIGVDRSDINKSFIQLTLEFHTKQKFEAYDSKGITVAGDKTKELLHLLNSKTMALPFLRKLHHISPNCHPMVSTSRFFTTQSPYISSCPEKPTVAYYDDLVNSAGRVRDFDKLHCLLNRRVRDKCYNSTDTFKFITNTDSSLSILGDLIRTLARLDKGLTRLSAYNMLIARLSKLDRIKESLHIVDIIAHRKYGLNNSSFHPILNSLTRRKKMDEAWQVIDMMKVMGVSPDITSFNYVLTAYCYSGNIIAATRVMKRIEEEKLDVDERTYDALVLGACKAGKVEGALMVLRRMEDDGVHVLYSTYVHVIKAFLNLGYYEQALKFVMIYGGRDAALDTLSFGILASNFVKLKRFEEAKVILKEMQERGLVMGDRLKKYYNIIFENDK